MMLLLFALHLGTKEAGPARVSLSVSIPSKGVGPGLALARLEMVFDGATDIAPPRLEDALAAWRIARAASSFAEGRTTWSAELEQVKPGAVGLPGVNVRLRAGDAWHDLEWHDLLGQTLGPAPPQPLPDPPAWPWWPWLLLATPLLLLLRRRRPVPQVSPRERFLATFDSLTGTPAQRIDGLVTAVRRYIQEEPERTPRFAELLRRSERLRFAPQPAGEDDCAALLVLAREATAQAGESG